MPLYEFQCPKCHARTNILSRTIGSPAACHCPSCGAADMVRTVSCFSHHRAAGPGPALRGAGGEDYYEDPRNIGRWTEDKFRDMGVELPAQIKDSIDKARQGELPDSLRDLKSGTPDAAYH